MQQLSPVQTPTSRSRMCCQCGARCAQSDLDCPDCHSLLPRVGRVTGLALDPVRRRTWRSKAAPWLAIVLICSLVLPALWWAWLGPMVATEPEEALADSAAAGSQVVFVALQSATSIEQVSRLVGEPERLRRSIRTRLPTLAPDNQTRPRLDAFWQIFDEFDRWTQLETWSSADWEAGRLRIAGALRGLSQHEPMAGLLISDFAVAEAHLNRIHANGDADA